jgi:hypothetical protein
VPPWVDFTPSQTVGSVFTIPPALLSFASETLFDALQGGGGPGLTGAVSILLRAAVAAVVNTRVHSYLFTTAQVISQTNTALATLGRTQMLALTTKLDQVNQECEVPSVYVSIIFGHQVLSVDRFTGATTVLYPNVTSPQLSPPIDPEGMAIGPIDGKLYVFDRDNDRIIRLDRTGNNLEIVFDRANATAPNNPQTPEAPSFTQTGDLYFNTAGFPDGSGGTQGIWTIGADQLSSLPLTGAVPTNVVTAAQLGSPLLSEGTAFDSNGNLFVVDSFSPEQVMRWDGSSVVTFIANGVNCNPCFEEPISVAVNSQDEILVSDVADRVKVSRFTPAGVFKDVYISFFDVRDHPFYMAFDAFDTLFVVAEHNPALKTGGKVWRVDPPAGPGLPATKTLLVDLGLALANNTVPGLAGDSVIGVAVRRKP